MDGEHLIYFSDPMCSWCWGFAPTVEAIGATFGERLPIRLIMGGLRPGATEVMNAAAKVRSREHWDHVREASGQAFGKGGLDRDGFIYDTDPAARAVVLARRQGMAEGLAYLRRVQEAFYARDLDVTTPEVLADLAAEQGLDRDAFLVAHAGADLGEETWRDYALSQRAGVTGFPTLIIGPRADGAYEAVTRGFQDSGSILPLLDQWLAARDAA